MNSELLVTGKYKGRYVIIETSDDFAKMREKGGHIKSLPKRHTLWFEEGQPMVIEIEAKDAHYSTPQEVKKYTELRDYYQKTAMSGNIIWDSNNLMIGNYVKRSNHSYWAPQFRGTITRITIDELIIIDTQAPKGIFEYIDLDDEWLDQFGFYVDKSRAHIKYNKSGNIFQLNKLNQYAGVTDENSAQIEAGITNGTIPLVRYEFTWGAVPIRHVHKLQNIASELTGLELVRKDGKGCSS